jgi:hypothetical protein
VEPFPAPIASLLFVIKAEGIVGLPLISQPKDQCILLEDCGIFSDNKVFGHPEPLIKVDSGNRNVALSAEIVKLFGFGITIILRDP